MRPSLKNGVIVLALSKPEQKKLGAAAELCSLVQKIAPVDPAVKAGAEQAAAGLTALLSLCVPADKEEPILDAIEDNDN